MCWKNKTILGIGTSLIGTIAYVAQNGITLTEGGYTPYPLNRECTGSDCPVTQWDSNWDKMAPEGSPTRTNRHIKRHVFLVRNGQYNVDVKNEEDKKLTDLGKAQIMAATSRLLAFNLPYKLVVASPSTRGIESFDILVDKIRPVESGISEPLAEGFPTAPSPKVPNLAEEKQYYRDVMRMEHAYRSIFRRPSEMKESDVFEICICPANMIRYFICRALQFPPQSWLRFQIAHASITWISIDGNGTVVVNCVADHGFLPYDKVTY